MQQFSKDKNIPIRSFTADETKNASGLNGPKAIADDIDTIIKMFDPDAEFIIPNEDEENDVIPGGISEKNLQNGAVSYEKLSKELKESILSFAGKAHLQLLREELEELLRKKADESSVFTKEEILIMHAALNTGISNADKNACSALGQLESVLKDLAMKADKSTTLSGYGITDAYTKEETEKGFLSKEGFVEEKANLATADMLNNAVHEVETSVSKKLEETVLYEDVVNTPVWTKQPTYEGALDSAFNTNDFYYVTLKDASENALPSGQFMLKEFYAEGATVYSTVFTLANLNTGSETLVENYPVEFTQIGATVKMRDAGVWEVAYNPSGWKLNGNYGSLSFVCDGQFIQRVSAAYFMSQFQTDKNVSHYHSVNKTSYQTDSDSKNMGIYIALNDGKAYKTNKFYNEFTITRISDTRYKTQRTVTLRYINFADGTPKVISGNEFGHGEIQQGDTFLKKMNVQVAANKERGFIRNGSVIRVTEVK